MNRLKPIFIGCYALLALLKSAAESTLISECYQQRIGPLRNNDLYSKYGCVDMCLKAYAEHINSHELPSPPPKKAFVVVLDYFISAIINQNI